MKTNRVFFLSFLTFFSYIIVFSQQEFSKWYFGNQAGLNFSTNPPTILINGVMNTGEGVATISDGSGNLLFYTDGIGVANSNHVVMANGNGLNGNQTSTQSALIVKQPGSNAIYYIFTTNPGVVSNGACYSIVDMSLAAGLGSVTVKNAVLYGLTCEGQVAVRHCNGRDAWIISHEYNSNAFKAYLLTSAGVSSTPIISAVGATLSGAGTRIGHMKISPDGKKLAMATYSNSAPSSLGLAGFYLFDFDAASGIISNSLTLLSTAVVPNITPYGVEFSPNGSRLYGATGATTSFSTAALYQWNICAANNSAVIASQYSISLDNENVGSLQWAIDGKIYLAINSTTQSISVINNPNASGAAMNFVLNAISLAPKNCRLGLPNYINGYTHSVPAPFTQSTACQTASFALPPVPTFSSGCSSTPYAPNGYLWDFGEPSAGAANSSTLSNPVHSYLSTGTYSVTLILYGNCTNDTLRQTVTLSTPGPSLNVSGNFLICKGEKFTYTASGASSYTWSTNSSATTITLAPQTTSVYSLSGTLNGCSLSKSFTVSVDPCTGISKEQDGSSFHVFPNPFKEVITVESQSAATLQVTDLEGRQLLERKVEKGKNTIHSSELAPGIYLIHIKNADNNWRGRFVKTE